MAGETYDVIVVGAGVSGLTAAYSVVKEKPAAKVLVLEAAEQMGGDVVCETIHSASGNTEWDTGPTRIGSSQKELLALLKELDIETQPQYIKGNRFWRLPDGKLKKFSSAIPPLPVKALVDLVRYFRKVDGMQGQIQPDQVHKCKNAEEWDGQTVAEFLKNYLYTEVGIITIETMTMSFCNALPSELSMTQYLYLIHTCGSWNLHTNSGDKGRSDLLIKEGSTSLCRKLCDRIGKDKIVCGDAVTAIADGTGDWPVRVTTAAGKEYSAKRAIVALPTSLTGKVNFEPPLRANRARTLPRKCDQLISLITYKSAFWREAGHSGEYMNMSSVKATDPNSEDQIILVSFDAFSSQGEPALRVFSRPEKLRGRSKEYRKDIILRLLSAVFGPQVMDCLDYTDKEWLYGSDTGEDRAPVSKSSELLAAVTKQHGRVHWAGSDAATAWCGTLNGAVQSARRAAQEVLTTI